MTVEEVLSNHDSEDEVDDDVADFEDRKVDIIFLLRSCTNMNMSICYLSLSPTHPVLLQNS
jgi:hypothetical protein